MFFYPLEFYFIEKSIILLEIPRYRMIQNEKTCLVPMII